MGCSAFPGRCPGLACHRPSGCRQAFMLRHDPSDSQGFYKPGFGSQDRILCAILWRSWTLWTKWTRKSIPFRVKSTGSTMSISSMVWSKEPRSTADFRVNTPRRRLWQFSARIPVRNQISIAKSRMTEHVAQRAGANAGIKNADSTAASIDRDIAVFGLQRDPVRP